MRNLRAKHLQAGLETGYLKTPLYKHRKSTSSIKNTIYVDLQKALNKMTHCRHSRIINSQETKGNTQIKYMKERVEEKGLYSRKMSPGDFWQQVRWGVVLVIQIQSGKDKGCLQKSTQSYTSGDAFKWQINFSRKSSIVKQHTQEKLS